MALRRPKNLKISKQKPIPSHIIIYSYRKPKIKNIILKAGRISKVIETKSSNELTQKSKYLFFTQSLNCLSGLF